MSANLNCWCGTGNLTRDPESRSLSSGKSVCSFSIAVNSGYGDKKKVMFLKITAWDKLGEFVNQYAKKGNTVAVTGPLECRKYMNSNGEEKESWEVTAREVQLIGGNRGGDGQQKGEASKPGYQSQDDIDEEIPF